MIGNILASKLGKKYKRYPSHWARLSEWLTGGRYCRHSEFWALRGISFEIKAGESVAIVGNNGAGKSTLLKILSGKTYPNDGEVQINGRVAALLELGMGFHPDFSGRQNAIMACQMNGHTRDEIKDLLTQIDEFSELGDYLDQPLRVYSTGMQMRLAFSAATVVQPEILIVDEALSVGDAYFQHKCIKRIRAFLENGTTLLFVSHDTSAVKALCRRVLLLDQGLLIRDGAPDAVLDYYNGMVARKSKDEEIRQVESSMDRIVTRSGTGEARIEIVKIYSHHGGTARAFRVGESAKIYCRILFNTTLENTSIGFLVRDRLGNDVFGTNTYHLCRGGRKFMAGETIEVIFALQLNLGVGHYSLSIAVHSRDTHLENNYDWWDQCIVFQVIPNDSYSFVGSAALPVQVKINTI